jgi:hypothetical protein
MAAAPPPTACTSSTPTSFSSVPHTKRNFSPIGEKRFAVNQDASVELIGFAGNMTTSNRRLQGVLGA